MGVPAETSPRQRSSGDLAGDRHVQAGHDVHDLAADGRFDFLSGQSPSAETASDKKLVPQDRRLNQRSAALLDRALPAKTPALLDHLDVAVAPGGAVLGTVAYHRSGARRDDHLGARRTLSNVALYGIRLSASVRVPLYPLALPAATTPAFLYQSSVVPDKPKGPRCFQRRPLFIWWSQ